MSKITPWLTMARPYGAGYQAPSTAFHILDKATLSIGKSSGPVRLSAPLVLPDYLEFLLDVVPVPLEGDAIINSDRYSRKVFGEILSSYQYRGIRLMATDTFRYNGQFDRVVDHPEIWLPSEGTIYELPFDCIIQDIHLNSNETSPIWALGGFYQEGCALDKIRQNFITFSVQNEEINHRVSPLEEWWERGLRPPQNLPEGSRLANARLEVPYLSLEDALRQGEAMVSVCIGIDQTGEEILETYHSIDASLHGSKQIMVTFKK